MKKNTTLVPLLLVIYSNIAFSQTDSVITKSQRWDYSVYGNLNYYKFNWDTWTDKRAAIDGERFIIEGNYKWTPKISLNAELEIEHGGVGTELEFDKFEEFGEFEYEISKGGEIWMEEMNLSFKPTDRLEIQAGRIKVPFALQYTLDEPTDFLTAMLPETEATLLPTNWTEYGISAHYTLGELQRWKIHAAYINGLDGTAFSSANFIKRGNQRRFEQVNAENWAFAGRIDYNWGYDCVAGVSFYRGDTRDNRPKPDFKKHAVVQLLDAHVGFKEKSLYVRAGVVYGTIQNSEALSEANRNLSNNLNVKRTPVGASALGYYGEVGYDFLSFIPYFQKQNKGADFVVYGRYDFYDSMYSTQGQIYNNPRWERSAISGGIKCSVHRDIQLKLQYSTREVGAAAATTPDSGTTEETIVAGVAFIIN